MRIGHPIQTKRLPCWKSVADYIESFHSRNGFSRERMTPQAAGAFDTAVQQLVRPFAQGQLLPLAVAATVIWGTPQNGQ